MLEAGKVRWAESIGFGNDWDQIDTRAKALHDFDIQGLQGMTSGPDEVQAGVDTEIDLVDTTGLLLLKHVGFVLVVKELDNGHPRVSVVDIIAEAGGINDGQAH